MQLVEPNELRRIRAALRLTQERLAERLGVRRETVGRWEIGTRRIPELAVRLLERFRQDARRRKARP